MNYIILNNENSMNIRGLLIQSLPPISKPTIRTRIEEIDGRSGDIVTKLGYGAYDKTLTIGLRGEFDENEVIRFFNTEGTAIFSNEPDKYYNVQILQQIDFEKLITFRTATVVLHTQPFKYEVDEKPIEASTWGDLTVINKGNEDARPIITIYGSGEISVSLNGNQIFRIDMGDAEYITLNMEEQNAYYGGVLMNRQVTGDFDSFKLGVGSNTITTAGEISQIIVEKYSRWV